jgi:cob(I)alamin adenosyltransferase
MAIRYVNRLSDLLFVLARWTAKATGDEELLWERGLRLPPAKKRTRASK